MSYRQRIEKKLARLDDHHRALSAVLAKRSTEELTRCPSEGWSILQVAQHLVLAERAILQPGTPMARRTPDPRKFKTRLFYFVVLLVLRLGIRVDVPSTNMVPDGQTSIDELDSQWEQTRAWLQREIEVEDDSTLRESYFRHPISGPMDLSQTLTLGLVHFESHWRKLNRRLEER